MPLLYLEDILPDESLDRHLKAAMVTHLDNGFLDADPDLEHRRSAVPLPAAFFTLARKKSTLYPLPLQRSDEAKIDGNIEYFRKTLDHLGIKEGL
jgi:hypothetical protein